MSDNELLCVLNNNKLILNLLEDELEENKLLFSYLMPKKKKPIDSLFLNHDVEGYFKILINRHLFENNVKFRESFFIVLLAMVNANYKFIVVDIGSYGKEGDSGIFLISTMGKQVLNRSFVFPVDSTLPGSNIVVPHVIVGDEAFRLYKHIMKPYTKKAGRDDVTKNIFNYRPSRARRVTENAFGLLSQVFRVFYQPINVDTSTCEDLIWVAGYLHNMLRNGGYMAKNNLPFYDYEDQQSTPTNNLLS